MDMVKDAMGSGGGGGGNDQQQGGGGGLGGMMGGGGGGNSGGSGEDKMVNEGTLSTSHPRRAIGEDHVADDLPFGQAWISLRAARASQVPRMEKSTKRLIRRFETVHAAQILCRQGSKGNLSGEMAYSTHGLRPSKSISGCNSITLQLAMAF